MNCGHECMRLTNDHDRLTGVVSLVQVKATKSPTVQLLTDSGSSCKHTHTHRHILYAHIALSKTCQWQLVLAELPRPRPLSCTRAKAQYCTLLYRTTPYCTLLLQKYSAGLLRTVQCSAVQHSAVQCIRCSQCLALSPPVVPTVQ